MKRIVQRCLVFTLLCSLAVPPPLVLALEEPLSDRIEPSQQESGVSSDVIGESAAAHSEAALDAEQLIEKPEERIAIPTPPAEQLQSAASSPMALPVSPADEAVAPVVNLGYSPLKADADVLITAFRATGGEEIDFLELHNMTSRAVDLSAYRVEMLYADSESEVVCPLQLTGFLLPAQDVVFARSDVSLQGSAIDRAQRFGSGGCGHDANQTLEMIEIKQLGVVVERIVVTPADPGGKTILGSWRRGHTAAGTYSTTYRSGVFSKDFVGLDRDLQASYLYTPVPPTDLRITEVLLSPRDCLVGDISLDCSDYVKITNVSSDPESLVDLSNYVLRSGFVTSTTKFELTGMIKSGDTIIINTTATGDPIALAANEGTVWLEDVHGLAQPYDMGVAAFQAPSSNKGRSWAYDGNDKTWKWATPAPYQAENDFTKLVDESVKTVSLVPCGEGQYRSAETNRCRKVAIVATVAPCKDGQYRSEETNRCRSLSLGGGTLTPCREGQYRSEETNRCRSFASTVASVVKPCADNQFRNPTTNRCKLIASVEDILSPCAEGKERSPDTNRCRNIVTSSIPSAAFAVEPIADTGKAFVGWWALGGVGAVAIGYGVFEWRREISRAVRQLGTFFASRK